MSPIHPENRDRYPKDWKEIRQRILARAEFQCECIGECGNETGKRCEERHGAFAETFSGVVVLTISHLNHIPEDCRPENLKAMCQACHLRYDRDQHAKSRRENRDRETGQLVLFCELITKSNL
jgi:hypothetical protein